MHAEGHEEILWNDGNILYLDCYVSCIGICNSNLSKCTLKYVSHEYKLYLQKVDLEKTVVSGFNK